MTNRSSRALFVLFSLAAAVLIGAPLHAQPMESLGTRALGMAGAFVAVADDPTAIYWNPAALAIGPYVGVAVEGQDLERGPDLLTGADRRRSFFVGAAVPSIGFGYYRLTMQSVVPEAAPEDGQDDPRAPSPGLLSLVTDNVGLTLLQSLADGIAVGGTLKYVRGTLAAGAASGPIDPGDENAWLDQAARLEGHSRGAFDLDLSAIAKFKVLRLGVVAQHLVEPTFASPEGVEMTLERKVRLGVAVEPKAHVLIDADIDLTRRLTVSGEERRRIALGAESPIGGRVVVRGGVRFDAEELGELVPAAGLSLGVSKRFWLDVQMTLGNSQNDHGWGIGGRFVM